MSCRDPLLLGPGLGRQEREATAASNDEEDAAHERFDLGGKLLSEIFFNSFVNASQKLLRRNILLGTQSEIKLVGLREGGRKLEKQENGSPCRV